MFNIILFRFEKETATTGKTKWNGVGFSLEDPRSLWIFGWYKLQTTAAKEKSDEIKMITHIISILKYYKVTQKDVKYPVTHPYLRCRGKSYLIIVVFTKRF